MSSKILSAAVIGLDAEIVEVESDIAPGDLGVVTVVGLPDKAVSESKERVKVAIKNSGLPVPKPKLIVNLAPADVKKYGPSYDVPIAISILTATDKIDVNYDLDKTLFIGELSLDGKLRTVSGILPIAIKARDIGLKHIFVPKGNAREANLVKGIEVIPVDNLRELAFHLNTKNVIKPLADSEYDFTNAKTLFDMAHIKGQEHVKRSMEISASGAHNMNILGTLTSALNLKY